MGGWNDGTNERKLKTFKRISRCIYGACEFSCPHQSVFPLVRICPWNKTERGKEEELTWARAKNAARALFPTFTPQKCVNLSFFHSSIGYSVFFWPRKANGKNCSRNAKRSCFFLAPRKGHFALISFFYRLQLWAMRFTLKYSPPRHLPRSGERQFPSLSFSLPLSLAKKGVISRLNCPTQTGSDLMG